ncbi:MAG: hypothetical protein ACOCWY_01450 [Thermodesulfobacteriota bacterium]
MTAEKEAEIQLLLRKIEKQELLFPLSETLGRELERLEEIEFIQQSSDNSTKECDPFRVVAEIRSLIQEHPFEDTQVHSNVDTLGADRKKLTLNMDLHGEFINFQDFMIELAQMSCVKSIEQVGVHPAYPNEALSLRIWISNAS